MTKKEEGSTENPEQSSQEGSQPNPNNNESSTNKSSEQPGTTTVRELEAESLKKDAAEYKDKYLRLLADMENMRKRMQKERQELTQYAVENIVVDFLSPIDNLENALRFANQMSDEVKNWAVGFQMILTQFKDALANNGITPITSQGEHFDPHSHEAVEMVESEEYPSGTIVEEYVKGYKMGDRTIRPARVKVAKKPTAPEQASQEQKD